MARVVVVGAGFVGTATGTVLQEHGHHVSYVDVNPSLVHELSTANQVVVFPEELRLDDVEFVFVSVPTPTNEKKGLNYEFLIAAATNLGRALRERSLSKRTIIVFRSTMLPGSTSQLAALIQDTSGLKMGKHYGVAYMPEYLRERHAVSDFRKPRLILLGTPDNDRVSRHALHELFSDFESEIHYSSLEVAEFQKYVHNLLNAVKISFFNEFRLIARQLNLDELEVDESFRLTVKSAEAIWRPDYGTYDLGPYGGNCLPKDMGAMIQFLQAQDFTALLLEAADATNLIIADDQNRSNRET